ncbi:MAG TPA: tetratricopeptide repeat protein [Elusimicrobiales bacterium]|nr:tetratricopeptide repeat protein [Elusimicrobiales bacterium]
MRIPWKADLPSRELINEPEEKNLAWKLPACIALIGGLLYAASLHFGFTCMDDDILILDQQSFLRNAGNFFEAFRHDVFFMPQGAGSYYRPLLTLSFMLDAQFGGAGPFVYHLTNVLLHLLASVLLFRLLLKLRYRQTPAFFFALFFTVHPAISQAVYWIPGRNDSLLAVFSLAAFLAALNFWASGARRYAAWHLFFFALALFTKETAVALIPVCLIYRFWVDKKTPAAALDPVLAWGWAGTAALFFLLRHFALTDPQLLSNQAVGMAANFLILLPFLGNILFPVQLAVLAAQRDMSVMYGLIALGFIAGALALSKEKRWSRIGFGCAWFLLFLLPSNGSFYSIFMPHRLYLPFIGIIFVLLEIDLLKKLKGAAAGVLGALLLAVFSTLTLLHGRNFGDRLSFWRNAAANSPASEVAQNGLAGTLAAAGRLEEAAVYFEKALWNNPEYFKPHYGWGCALAARGRDAEAEAHYREALRLAPKNAEIYNSWGLLLAGQGRAEQAIARYRHALWLRPDYAQAQQNWGLALDAQNRPEAAAEHYREALRLDPGFGGAHYNWGVALAGQGRDEEAIAQFRAALQAEPENAEAHNNLGVLLVRRGRTEEAAAHYREALRLAPQNAEAHYNSGLLLAGRGRYEEAIARYRTALRLRPAYGEAHNNWGIALVKAGRPEEAVEHFREALKDAASASRARENLGIAQALKKRGYR